MTTKNSVNVCSIGIIALFIFFTPPSVHAAGWNMGPDNAMALNQGRRPEMSGGIANMKWWNNDRLTASMHLTDIQKDALEEYSNKHQLAMIDLRASVQKTQLILETSLDLNFSKDASLKYLTDYLEARNAFEEVKMKGLIRTREILTEEQFEILKNHTRNFVRRRLGENRDPGMKHRMDQRGMK